VKSLPKKSNYKIDYDRVEKFFPFEGSVVGRSIKATKKVKPKD
jgi:hypothetical protein